MKNHKIIILILLLIFLWSCRTSDIPISSKDVSSIYNPMTAAIHPEYKIYHNSDTSSLLFFKLRTFELLYRANDETGKNKSQLKIFYKLYSSIDSKTIADSATTIINLNKSANNYLVSYIPFRAQMGNNYTLEIATTDILRNTTNHQILEVNKTNAASSQFFLFTDKETNHPIFLNFIKDPVKIKINNKIAGNEPLTIERYLAIFPPALPPFSAEFEKFDIPKPKKQIELTNQKDLSYEISEPGIYSFKLNNNDSLHSVINYFNEYFPEFKTSDQLLEALIYLNSSKEYKALKAFENPKFAIDSFWLNTTGNIERAKELIRIYYNRAQLANYYFTSYKEGWKTDRGMIYMVLGMPTTIFKSSDAEIWTYGKSASYKNMEFTFNRKYHPFCENHFVLDRSEIYDRLWYQAVDTWRNGRAFSVMK